MEECIVRCLGCNQYIDMNDGNKAGVRVGNQNIKTVYLCDKCYYEWIYYQL